MALKKRKKVVKIKKLISNKNKIQEIKPNFLIKIVKHFWTQFVP